MKRQIIRSILLSMAIALLTVNSYAATWKKVVVAIPEADVFFSGGVDATYASMITDKLVSAFEATGKIETKNDSDIEQIMKTMKEAQAMGGESACKTDDKCMLRIAQKMQVGYVAKLKVVQNEGEFTVTLRMIKVNADKDIEQITRDASSKRAITSLVTEMGTRVALSFPALEGKITAVMDDSIFIDHGSTSGLKKDTIMIVKRKETLKDDEGNVIHETFKELGKIALVDVSGTSSSAVIKKGKNFQKGDSVFVDEEQFLKEMKEKEERRRKEEEKRKKDESDLEKAQREKSQKDAERERELAANRSSDSYKDSVIADRKLKTYLTLRAGTGTAEMADSLLSEVYPLSSLVMAEAVLGSNTFGIFGRFTNRGYEMEEDFLKTPTAVKNGIIYKSEVDINSGDLGMRLYLGPEFYWFTLKLYGSIAMRMNSYTEKTVDTLNEIEYNFTAYGWVYGVGAELILFNTLGVFAEYNAGNCEIGEETPRNIEGGQVIFGATLKI